MSGCPLFHPLSEDEPCLVTRNPLNMASLQFTFIFSLNFLLLSQVWALTLRNQVWPSFSFPSHPSKRQTLLLLVYLSSIQWGLITSLFPSFLTWRSVILAVCEPAFLIAYIEKDRNHPQIEYLWRYWVLCSYFMRVASTLCRIQIYTNSME